MDEVFHRHEAYDEGNDVAQKQHGEVVARSEHFDAAVLDQIVDLLERGAEHGGYGQEEGEFGGVLAAEALLHAADDGGHGARGAGKQRGDALIETDDEGAAVGEGRFVGGVVEKAVAKEHEHTAHDEHHGHHLHAFEVLVDDLLEGHADHHSGQNADHEFQVERPNAAPPRAAFTIGGRVEKATPIEHHDRKDGAELDDDRESLDKVGHFDAKQAFGNHHVSG